MVAWVATTSWAKGGVRNSHSCPQGLIGAADINGLIKGGQLPD